MKVVLQSESGILIGEEPLGKVLINLFDWLDDQIQSLEPGMSVKEFTKRGEFKILTRKGQLTLTARVEYIGEEGCS